MAEPKRLDDRQEQFLRTMLTLEPEQWATVGLGELGSFRQRSEPEATKQVPRQDQMQAHEFLQLLDSCKKNFWQDHSEESMTKLREASVEKYPELKAAADRIQRWYHVRPELQELAKKMGKDSLAGKLQLMATMSAREIAILKAKITQQSRIWFGPNYRKQAMRIKRQHPEIYALDPEWFDELRFWPNLRYK